MTPSDNQLIFTAITGIASGSFGVGVAYASLRGSIKKIMDDIEKIKKKQDNLRGNGGDQVPLFIRRGECEKNVLDCTKKFGAELREHSKSIKMFERYARYELTQKGLEPKQINDILNDG